MPAVWAEIRHEAASVVAAMSNRGPGAARNQDQLLKVSDGAVAGAIAGGIATAAAEGGGRVPIREEVGRRSKTIPSEWERDIKGERVREQDHIARVWIGTVRGKGCALNVVELVVSKEDRVCRGAAVLALESNIPAAISVLTCRLVVLHLTLADQILDDLVDRRRRIELGISKIDVGRFIQPVVLPSRIGYFRRLRSVGSGIGRRRDRRFRGKRHGKVLARIDVLAPFGRG